MEKIIKVAEVLTLCKLATLRGMEPDHEKWWKESLDAIAYPEPPAMEEDPEKGTIDDVIRLIEACGYVAGARRSQTAGNHTLVLVASSLGAATLATVADKVQAFLGVTCPTVWTSGVNRQLTCTMLYRGNPGKASALHLVAQQKEAAAPNRIVHASMPSLRNLARNAGWMIGQMASTSVDAMLMAVPVGEDATQSGLEAAVRQAMGLGSGVWSGGPGYDDLKFTTPDIKLTVHVVWPARAYPNWKDENAYGLNMEKVREALEILLKSLPSQKPAELAQTLLALSSAVDRDSSHVPEWLCRECNTVHPAPKLSDLRCPTPNCPGLLHPSSLSQRRLEEQVDQQVAINDTLRCGMVALLEQVGKMPGAAQKCFTDLRKTK